MEDYTPYVNTAKEYDTDAIQLAFDRDTLQPTLKVKEGDWLVFHDGIFIPVEGVDVHGNRGLYFKRLLEVIEE